MDRRAWLWTGGALLASVLLVGIPYFRTPYSQVDFTGVLGLGAVSVFVGGMLAVWLGRAKWWVVAILMSAVIPAVVAARVFVDVLADPTSHNLWPFELLITAPMGLLLGIGGAGFGRLVSAWFERSGKRPADA